MCWWAGLALAGELYVATAVPVHVWVDGNYVPFEAGTLTAHLSGLSGVHRVQVSGADNVVIAETQLQVPWDSARRVVFDGVSLVIMAPGGVPAPLPAPAPAPAPVPAGPVAMSQ